jgi:hypothetical protein
MAAPGITGRGFFIGFFQRITLRRDREAGLRNKRLRENPRQNKAFSALRRRFSAKIVVQNVENTCILRRFQPYRAAS